MSMSETFERVIAAVSSIKAIPTILDIVCRTAGMRFAAVARVTEDDGSRVVCAMTSTLD
jgi:hypothetical protein